MSTNRIREDAGWVPSSRLPKGPNGRPLCRQCGTEVSGRRRTFCSDACVHEWRIRTDPGYVREQVFARDRGICALCGLDTMAFQRSRPARSDFSAEAEAWRERARAEGWPDIVIRAWGPRSPWDADHIVPVIEGGGECDLDNYRTLCVPCHNRVTAELKARLAQRRRDEAIAATGQVPLIDLTEQS